MAFRQPYTEDPQTGLSSSSSGSSMFPFINTESLVIVPIEFIQDTFNHTDLRSLFSDFDSALKFLVYSYQSDNDDTNDDIVQLEAGLLYGLLHQRFVSTDPGLAKVKRMVLDKKFGGCMREGCADCHLVPLGVSDSPGVAPLGGFCPHCREVYVPLNFESEGSDVIDGAFYGTSVAHILLQKYPDLGQRLIDSALASNNTDDPGNYPTCRTLSAHSRVREKKCFGFSIMWDSL